MSFVFSVFVVVFVHRAVASPRPPFCGLALAFAYSCLAGNLLQLSSNGLKYCSAQLRPAWLRPLRLGLDCPSFAKLPNRGACQAARPPARQPSTSRSATHQPAAQPAARNQPASSRANQVARRPAREPIRQLTTKPTTKAASAEPHLGQAGSRRMVKMKGPAPHLFLHYFNVQVFPGGAGPVLLFIRAGPDRFLFQSCLSLAEPGRVFFSSGPGRAGFCFNPARAGPGRFLFLIFFRAGPGPVHP